MVMALTAEKENEFDFNAEKRKIHWLKVPHGVNSQYIANLRWQMNFSVQTLEEQLVAEGNPHVLILYTKSNGGKDRNNPDRFQLSADGTLVAYGDGKFAKECFYESGEKFRDICREAIETADLIPLSEHDYYILSCSKNILKAVRGQLDDQLIWSSDCEIARPNTKQFD